MSIQDRNTLKGFFRKGQMPLESHFHDFIDSSLNKVDDGLSKNAEDGLMLAPSGASQKMMSFYKNIQDRSSLWSLCLNKGNSNLSFSDYIGNPVLTLTLNGNVGIGKEDPQYSLDVNGTVGMQGRVGTHKQGTIPADGKWHPILENLNGVNAFEIMAGIGKKKTGKYALIHAVAMSTYGKSDDRIHIRQARYGSWRNKIQIRWGGDTFKYFLEMRTRSDYEGPFVVQYFISQLWQDIFMDGSMVNE